MHTFLCFKDFRSVSPVTIRGPPSDRQHRVEPASFYKTVDEDQDLQEEEEIKTKIVKPKKFNNHKSDPCAQSNHQTRRSYYFNYSSSQFHDYAGRFLNDVMDGRTGVTPFKIEQYSTKTAYRIDSTADITLNTR